MPKSKDEPQDTFNEVIEAIDAGEVEPNRHLSIQIDNSLREAICAARDSGQGASVTITVKVKPGGGDRRITFAANVNAKLPRPPVSAVTLYADDDGHIHKSDPDQMRLPYPAPTPLNRKDA